MIDPISITNLHDWSLSLTSDHIYKGMSGLLSYFATDLYIKLEPTVFFQMLFQGDM